MTYILTEPRCILKHIAHVGNGTHIPIADVAVDRYRRGRIREPSNIARERFILSAKRKAQAQVLTMALARH